MSAAAGAADEAPTTVPMTAKTGMQGQASSSTTSTFMGSPSAAASADDQQQQPTPPTLKPGKPKDPQGIDDDWRERWLRGTTIDRDPTEKQMNLIRLLIRQLHLSDIEAGQILRQVITRRTASTTIDALLTRVQAQGSQPGVQYQ